MGLVSTLPLILPLTLPSHHCFLFLFLLLRFCAASFLDRLAGILGSAQFSDSVRHTGFGRTATGFSECGIGVLRARSAADLGTWFPLPYNCTLRQLLPHHAPTATIPATATAGVPFGPALNRGSGRPLHIFPTAVFA